MYDADLRKKQNSVPFLVILVCVFGLAGCNQLLEKEEEEVGDLIEGYQGELIRDLDEDEFDDFTRISGRLVVVDFYADWCGPCRQLGPILEKLTREFDGTVVLGKVDVDQAKGLARRMGVNGIPDVRLYLDGKEVESFKGAPPEGHVKELFASYAPLDGMIDANAATVSEGSATGGPAVQPMSKDWMPPGIQRK